MRFIDEIKEMQRSKIRWTMIPDLQECIREAARKGERYLIWKYDADIKNFLEEEGFFVDPIAYQMIIYW